GDLQALEALLAITQLGEKTENLAVYVEASWAALHVAALLMINTPLKAIQPELTSILWDLYFINLSQIPSPMPSHYSLAYVTNVFIKMRDEARNRSLFTSLKDERRFAFWLSTEFSSYTLHTLKVDNVVRRYEQQHGAKLKRTGIRLNFIQRFSYALISAHRPGAEREHAIQEMKDQGKQLVNLRLPRQIFLFSVNIAQAAIYSHRGGQSMVFFFGQSMVRCTDLIGLFQGPKLRFAKPGWHSAGLTISVGQRISFPNSAHGPGRPFDGLLRSGLFQFPGHQQHQQHAAEQTDPGPFEGGGGVADEACQQGHEGGYGIAATLDEGQQCAGLGGRAGVVEGDYQLQREERAYTQPDQQYRGQHQLDGRDDQAAEAGEDDAEHQTQQWPAIGEAVYQGGHQQPGDHFHRRYGAQQQTAPRRAQTQIHVVHRQPGQHQGVGAGADTEVGHQCPGPGSTPGQHRALAVALLTAGVAQPG